MKTQTHQQFDFFSGQFEAMKGMGLAGGAAGEWVANAYEWFEAKPAGYEFTSDDLRKAVGVVNTGVNKNNAVGAWFSAMSKEGLIAPTGRYRRSEVVSRHASLIRVWRKTDPEREHRKAMLKHGLDWIARNVSSMDQ